MGYISSRTLISDPRFCHVLVWDSLDVPPDLYGKATFTLQHAGSSGCHRIQLLCSDAIVCVPGMFHAADMRRRYVLACRAGDMPQGVSATTLFDVDVVPRCE